MDATSSSSVNRESYYYCTPKKIAVVSLEMIIGSAFLGSLLYFSHLKGVGTIGLSLMGTGAGISLCTAAVVTLVCTREKSASVSLTKSDSISEKSSSVSLTGNDSVPEKSAVAPNLRAWEKLIKKLPAEWKSETSGVIFDPSIFDINEYRGGKYRPDVSNYRYNSVFLHVFSDAKRKNLNFGVCEINNKGKATIRTFAEFNGNQLYSAKYISYYPSPIALLRDYCVQEKKTDLNIATPIKIPEVPSQVAEHPAYKGAFHSHAVELNDQPYVIIYDYDSEFFILRFPLTNVSFKYDSETKSFRALSFNVERPDFADFVEQVSKKYEKACEKD